MRYKDNVQYPLRWPASMQRTAPERREDGDVIATYSVIVEIRHVLRELGISPSAFTISSNARHISRFPRPPKRSERRDPGVALYFSRTFYQGGRMSKVNYCIPCDTHDVIGNNLLGVLSVLNFLSDAREDAGEQLFSQCLTAFEIRPPQRERKKPPEATEDPPKEEPSAEDREEEDAEPEEEEVEPSQDDEWYEALGFSRPPETLQDAERSYRQLIKKFHPDTGGSKDVASILNAAISEARDYFE